MFWGGSHMGEGGYKWGLLRRLANMTSGSPVMLLPLN